jgi:hypothetical protein
MAALESQPNEHGWIGHVDQYDAYAVDFSPIEAFDSMDTVVGANYEKWPAIVPAGQLWADAHEAASEWPHILLHEAVETTLMRAGWTYDEAHEVANYHERLFMQEYQT